MARALKVCAVGNPGVSVLLLIACVHILQPVLTREACDLISMEYTKLRAQENVSSDKAKVCKATMHLTGHQLETASLKQLVFHVIYNAYKKVFQGFHSS